LKSTTCAIISTILLRRLFGPRVPAASRLVRPDQLADPAGDSVSIRGCLRRLFLEVDPASNDRHRSLDLLVGLVSSLGPRHLVPRADLVSNRDRHRQCPDLEVGLVSNRDRRRHSVPLGDLVSNRVFAATIQDLDLNADAPGDLVAPVDPLHSSALHPWTTAAGPASRAARPDVVETRAAAPPAVPGPGLAPGLRDPREPGPGTSARESDVSSHHAGF
jgi:hypothetical protein